MDARTGAHPDFDRLVFDLHGTALPRVDSTTNTTGDYPAGGSGEIKKLQIAGKSYLLLDISGEAQALPNGANAYTTPAVQPVSLPSLKGVQLTSSGYEGHVTFGLSLGDYSRYQISTLTAPNRVVVDIYHSTPLGTTP
ncbi:hypothetical protein ACFYNY_24060 [Streptomyces sp. NPDC006530]|uniref:AMIN-like domain-containing (lipo)protein n=1 Tax=Streptomyces sp. NPDC006530 TaxID=3364750 RepID=UPI0036B1AD29